MAKLTEKQLDKAIEEQFKKFDEFSNWFLNQTKFANRPSKLVFSRSNSPWHKSRLTGKESETDILVVFEETETSRRFAIHIENKLSNGRFEPSQPRQYHERAMAWIGNKKYSNYLDYEVVLVAPRAFYDRNKEEAGIFDRYVSHEDIARFIPEFGA
jgi:hypothetical protein